MARRALLSLLGALWLAACAAAAREDAPLRLVVLHTNDVHGALAPRGGAGGLLRLAGAIERVRAELGPDARVVLVDAGDWFQGTPEGRVEDGAAFTRLLGSLGYDAMAVGNHELDHGVDAFAALLAETGVPAICANARVPGAGADARAPWGEPWRVVERGGLRVALVGLLTPDTPSITHPSARALAFDDPVDALGTALRALAETAEPPDLVVPVTHLGVEADRRLAEAFDLPLIVGGHSHTRLPRGIVHAGTTIVQTGVKARALGRADVWIDPATRAVVRVDASLIELDSDVPVDPDLARAAAALAERARADFDRVVGRLAAPLERRDGVPASSSGGNLICDLFRARTGADVGVYNKGGIRTDLPAGPVTRRDLFELLPFDDTVVVLDVTGAELSAALARAVEGRKHAGIEVSGLTLLVETRAGQVRLVAVEAGGAPLDPDRRYRVATGSFLARGGDGYFEPGVRVAVDTGLLPRDLCEQALAAVAALEPPDDERYLPARSAGAR